MTLYSTFCLLLVFLPMNSSRFSNVKDFNKTESSLAKFLKEPELGTSWYDPDGPTPTFLKDQLNGSEYEALLGGDVLMDCKVTSLEKDLVSWIRKDSRNGLPEVLTVGFVPHSAQNRFILDFSPPNNYRLRVQRVRWEDDGVYLCQLAVHPPKLMWTTLRVIRPIVHLLDGDGNPVLDLHYDSGSTIDLLCRVRRPPKYQVSIQWEFRAKNGPVAEDDVHILNYDVTRGGVKVETERDLESGHVLSRLKLSRATAMDTGKYTCRMDTLPGETESPILKGKEPMI